MYNILFAFIFFQFFIYLAHFNSFSLYPLISSVKFSSFSHVVFIFSSFFSCYFHFFRAIFFPLLKKLVNIPAVKGKGNSKCLIYDETQRNNARRNFRRLSELPLKLSENFWQTLQISVDSLGYASIILQYHWAPFSPCLQMFSLAAWRWKNLREKATSQLETCFPGSLHR